MSWAGGGPSPVARSRTARFCFNPSSSLLAHGAAGTLPADPLVLSSQTRLPGSRNIPGTTPLWAQASCFQLLRASRVGLVPRWQNRRCTRASSTKSPPKEPPARRFRPGKPDGCEDKSLPSPRSRRAGGSRSLACGQTLRSKVVHEVCERKPTRPLVGSEGRRRDPRQPPGLVFDGPTGGEVRGEAPC